MTTENHDDDGEFLAWRTTVIAENRRLRERAEAAEARVAELERERDELIEDGERLTRDLYDARNRLADTEAAESRVAEVEAALRDAEDFRAEIAIDAFTAPDADWWTILDSLRARIRDLGRDAPADTECPHCGGEGCEACSARVLLDSLGGPE